MEKAIYTEETECPMCGKVAVLSYPQDRDYVCECGRIGMWDTYGMDETPLYWC